MGHICTKGHFCTMGTTMVRDKSDCKNKKVKKKKIKLLKILIPWISDPLCKIDA